MAQLSLSELDIDPSSYVDPNGFVFMRGDEVLRAIRPEPEPFYRGLFADGSIDKWVRDHNLVETEISDHTIPEIDCKLVLRHRRVDPLSYCVEWCPSMLHAAALATLDLAAAVLERGCLLQDAYPFNVLFDGTRPVFVDFTSIVPSDTPLLWPAHQQFMNFFLNPLELATMGKGRTARALLYDQIDGVSSDDVLAERTAGYSLRHPLKSSGERISAALSRRIQDNASLKKKLQDASRSERFAVQDTKLRVGFFRRLRKRVEGMSIREASDTWRNYYDGVEEVTSSDAKEQRVDALLGELAPETVLDLGCNVGRYSVIAARRGASVRAVDGSEHCIESLYSKSLADGLPIVPVVGNVLAPTPAFGFLSRQFPSLFERFRSDVVLCLGLMHHLHINGRQSFERITALLDAGCTRAAIFEYVDMDDGNIRLLDHGRPIDYDLPRVRGELEKRFRVREFDSDRSTRRLLLCEK